MAKYTINRGSTANDGTGDNLRAGADKVNLNFDEIYTAIGDGTTLAANIKVKDDSSTVATINAKGETLGILGGTGLSSTLSGSDVTLAITGFGAGADVIPGKVEGTNFTDSLLIGHSTTGTLSTASGNTGVGIDALDGLTSGDGNVAVGKGAGGGLTTGGGNTFIGHSAGQATSGGAYNTAIGYLAGASLNTNAQYNILVGEDAGDNISSGKGNVVLGKADVPTATGDRQLSISGFDGTTTTTWITGDSAGKVTIPGDLDVQGTQTTIDSATIQITNSFTFEGTTSDDNETVLSVIDPTADRTVSLPDATGTVVLQDTTDTLTNKTLTSPYINEVIFEGATADDYETTLAVTDPTADRTATIPDFTGDIILGKFGGTNFSDSILIGTTSTGTLNSATDNIGIGSDALRDISSGDQNVAIGTNAGRAIATNSYNTFIGRNAGVNASGTTNVGIGPNALEAASFSGGANMAIGFGAGSSVTTGEFNTFIGKEAGDNVTTGDGNMILGGGVDATSATGDRQLKIAGYDGTTTTTWIDGDSSGNVTVGGTVSSSTSGSKIRFDYANPAAFPNETTYEGMFAYDLAGDAPYVADSAGWAKIITENMSVSALSDVNISGIADSYALVYSSAQSRFNAAAIPTAGFSIAMAVAL